MEADRSARDTARPPSRSSTPDAKAELRGRVLVVDDETLPRNAIAQQLRHRGYEVEAAASVAVALEHVAASKFDVVVSDMSMPEQNGIDLLRAIRLRDLTLPVIFLTGRPSLDTASAAVELGAFRYLTKPTSADNLVEVIVAAMKARELIRAQDTNGEGAQLEITFRSALETLWIAFQPIVSVSTQQAIAYEALVRCREPKLPHPGALLAAAEKLGLLHMLGRRIRATVARDAVTAPRGAGIFVNLHAADLADSDLYDVRAPLSKMASHVVLEITERASLESIPDVANRLGLLRAMGYRIAIDDLGAGYAGLSYFAVLAPDVAKIDMSLVRGVHEDPVKQRVVRTLLDLTRGLGMEVVAEGVETLAERECLINLGCTLLQGYLLGRPAAGFAAPQWPR